MKIAVITSGILPVPAVQGGAVEDLIDLYLEYNNIHKQHEIYVYSSFHPDVKESKALKSNVNKYYYIYTNNWRFKLSKKLYRLFSYNDFYDNAIEYFFERVNKDLRKHNFDVLLIENRPGFAIKLKKRFPKIPIISHMHTNNLYDKTEQTYDIIKSTDGFIVVSEYIKKEIEKIGFSTKIRVVYNGLDNKLFRKKDTAIKRTTIGFSEEDFVVVFSGRLVPDKGIKELLLAIKELSIYSDIKVLVIGGNIFDPYDEYNPFIEELRIISKQLGNRIIYTGHIPHNDIPNYLSISDVVVVPSHINEAFGMVCIEACAMGLPVIATNDGGITEALKGQKCIIIDKSKEIPYQIATAVLEIKNNYQKYKGNFLDNRFFMDTYSKSFFKNLTEIL